MRARPPVELRVHIHMLIPGHLLSTSLSALLPLPRGLARLFATSATKPANATPILVPSERASRA